MSGLAGQAHTCATLGVTNARASGTERRNTHWGLGTNVRESGKREPRVLDAGYVGIPAKLDAIGELREENDDPIFHVFNRHVAIELPE